jgi:hypothetical protein
MLLKKSRVEAHLLAIVRKVILSRERAMGKIRLGRAEEDKMDLI